MIGCAIEGASGLTYEQYMQRHVWTAAGMPRTRLDRLWDIVPDRARGYYRVTEAEFKTLPPAAQLIAKPGEIYNAPLHDTSMKIPGGGLLSTAEDLVRFGIAVQTGDAREPEDARRDVEEWARRRAGRRRITGSGGACSRRRKALRRISHNGNQIGAASGFIIIPEVQLTYALLTNLEDVDIPRLTRGVGQILRKYLMP